MKKNVGPFPNIEPLHRAASDEDKALIFNEFPALYSEYNSLVLPEIKNAGWMKSNPAQAIEVAGVRLDDYFAEGTRIPTIVKVDVEGAEPQVLRGMEQFLRRNAPLVVMEYLLSSSQNKAHREAVAFAQGLDYQVFRIEESGELEPCTDVEVAMTSLGLDSDNLVLCKQ